MKLFLYTASRPQVEDVDVFDIPSKPSGARLAVAMMVLFPHGEDFWTVPLSTTEVPMLFALQLRYARLRFMQCLWASDRQAVHRATPRPTTSSGTCCASTTSGASAATSSGISDGAVARITRLG
jgi:hypothetical protein